MLAGAIVLGELGICLGEWKNCLLFLVRHTFTVRLSFFPSTYTFSKDHQKIKVLFLCLEII